MPEPAPPMSADLGVTPAGGSASADAVPVAGTASVIAANAAAAAVKTQERCAVFICSFRLRRSRRFFFSAAVVAIGLGLFTCYLRESLTVAPTSDGAANALQAWDMLHGNVLLHGWALSDVSFYTTELPEYMLVEWVHGLTGDVVNIAGALTYTVLVLAAALLAKGSTTGRQAALRLVVAAGIMLSPQVGSGVSVLMLQSDHVGTTVPVLLAWLIMDRAGRRPWVPLAVGGLLAWALIADPVVLYIGIAPLLAVASTRAYAEVVCRRGRLSVVWFELSLIVAALVATAIGLKAPALIGSFGGYHVASAPNAFGAAAQMTSRVWLTVQGILLLFGANFLGSTFSFGTALVLLHLAGLALAAWAFGRGVRHFARTDDLVVDLLVAGTAIIVAAYLVGVQAANLATTREIAAVLPFGAVLAGRLAADRLPAAKLVPAAAVVLAGYALTLAANVSQATAPSADGQLATWLTARGYRYGLANYWQANAVTLASRNQVQIRALTTGPTHLIPYRWESKNSWYDPDSHRASFVALLAVPPTNEHYLPVSWVRMTFGPPARTYHVGRYTVLVWNYNLLTRL